MTQHQWINVVSDYHEGNTSSFDRIIDYVYRTDFRGQLIYLTQSEEDAWDVYVEAILKFRERHLLEQLPLPKNVNAYLYQMQRNIWVDICRKRNAKRQIKYKPLETEGIKQVLLSVKMEKTSVYSELQEEEKNHMHALTRAVQQLCDKCRTLLERHVFEGEKLKVLKLELGYMGSYQTVVAKKKSCIKKLAKLFFVQLNKKEGFQELKKRC